MLAVAGATVVAQAGDPLPSWNDTAPKKKPDNVADSAFIQTVPNRNFIAALRLYGTGVEFFDQSWKPDDLVKMK